MQWMDSNTSPTTVCLMETSWVGFMSIGRIVSPGVVANSNHKSYLFTLYASA